MTGKELILNVVNRKSSGGILPVYFSFAEKKAEYRFAQYMGMTSNELREWMRNDLVSIYPVEDVQFLSMTGGSFELAKELGFAKDSPLPNAMTDRFGCTWSIDCIGQELRKGCVEDIEDIYSFPFPSPDHPDSLYGIREQIEELDRCGLASVVHQNHNLFERSWAMVGYEDFLAACYTNIDEVDYLLDRLTEIKVRMAERICELHPTLGHTGDDFGLQAGGVMSLEMFRRFFKPRYEKIWKVYSDRGIPVLHHSCGNCALYLEDMIEAGLNMLNPVQQSAMDIGMLSERFGDSLSFFGSIDTIRVINTGTPDDVRRNVDDTVRILGKNNGLLLSMLNVMPETPMENVKAAVEQILSYRNS